MYPYPLLHHRYFLWSWFVLSPLRMHIFGPTLILFSCILRACCYTKKAAEK